MTKTPAPQIVLPDCPVCNGTGRDEDFNSPCNCATIQGAFVRPAFRMTLNEVTTATRSGNGNGTGSSTRPERVSGDEVKALAEWLATQTWSDFAVSISNFYFDRGYLSQKQFDSASKMKAKCDARKPAPVVEEPKEVAVDGIPTAPCAIGTFTLTTEYGHRTFRTAVQPADAKFAPGETIISYLAGSDNESDYVGFGFVKQGGVVKVWKRFSENAELLREAEVALAGGDDVQFAQRCLMCNRMLTTPSSISNLIGPECAKKL